MLLGAQADIEITDGATPLYLASQNGHTETIKELVRLGARLDSGRNDGATPLYTAAQHGNLAALQALLELGAFVLPPPPFPPSVFFRIP